jgi:phage-related protein
VRTTIAEHETEDKAQARGAESQRQDGALPVAELANAPPAVLNPRMLLGLQAMAGNAAVANLIETRKPEPAAAVPQQAPEETQAEGSPPVSAEAPPIEDDAVAAPRAGETDDDLAALDVAADAPPAEGTAAPEGDREQVAQDAQAELADTTAASPETPPAPAGAAEPGVPIEKPADPAVPDVATAEPATGLARVGGLPPALLLSSLGTVSNAVDRHVSDEHDQLVANTPQRARHPGAPSTVESPASTRLPPVDQPAPASIPKMPEGRDVEVRRPPAPAQASGLMVTNGQLPTRDPGLELKPGPLPQLPLDGNADPANVQQQRSHLLGGLEREKAGGQQEAIRPLGEDEIFPTAPAETLRASVGEMPGGGGQAAAQPKPGEGDGPASIIAQQEKGGEIQSAVSTGLTALAGQRQEYAQRTAGERARADAEMTQLEHANVQEQAGERATAKREVLGLRGQWSTAQQDLVTGAQGEADAKTSETLQTVAQERGAAEQQATAHYEQGQQEAQKVRHEAEQQAASEKQKAQGQSPGGLLGAIGSAAQSLFDKAKEAVQSVFDRARQLVRGAVERAQQLATAVMERARQAIVSAIRTAGTLLTAIGDRVLVAFPALRDRFRRAIQERIAAAEAVVNKLASALKQSVQGALNLLSAALSAAIGLMRIGMQAAIDGVRAVVHGALEFAHGAISALGTFAVLVKDIAANPGRWISNLAAAARDGIRNHLWPDLKAAVQGWFNEKVDAVLGLGPAVWSLLRRGGITVAQAATFAWDGIKSMIPQTIIWVLIEKLVALIVPAAAAVMLIIQALQAAWGSLGRILQAFDAFIAFLKGVRWGNAGPLFGKAIAAGAVAVIEFISQFLLQRLMGAAGAVAGKLRSLAKRIGGRLAAVGRGAIRGAKAVGRGIRAGTKRVLGAVAGGASRVVRGASELGHGVRRGFERLTGRSGSREILPGHEFATASAFTLIEKDGTKAVRYGPLNPGPLHKLRMTVVESFRSASYTGRTLAQPKDLYRAFSDPESKFGAYWTDLHPSGPLQSKIDSALRPSFGNAATEVVQIRVPANQTIFEGYAAAQAEEPGVRLLGGGRQVVLTDVDPSWEVK